MTRFLRFIKLNAKILAMGVVAILFLCASIFCLSFTTVKEDTSVNVYAETTPSGNWSDNAASRFAGGLGTESAPYQIATAEQLAYFAKKSWESPNAIYICLTSSIDMSAHYWDQGINAAYTKILTSQSITIHFNGEFNGKKNSISGLAAYYHKEKKKIMGIEYSTDCYGQNLFSKLAGGSTIENLTVKSSRISVRDSYTGILVGETSGDVSITNCKIIDSSVENTNKSSYGATGGFVGSAGGSLTFENCSIVNSKVESSSGRSGGFVGYVDSFANLNNCVVKNIDVNSNSSGILDTYESGGLIGKSNKQVYFTNCSIEGSSIKSISSRAGGMIGNAASSAIIKVCKAKNISVSANSACGGLVGKVNSTLTLTDCSVTNSNSEKIESKKGKSGGLIGYVDGTAKITSCEVYGVIINGYEQVGGIIGYVKSIDGSLGCHIRNSTIQGSGSDDVFVGGILGYVEKDITFSNMQLTDMTVKSTGNNNNSIGILAGYCNGSATINQVFVNGKIESKSANTGGLIGYVNSSLSVVKSQASVTITNKQTDSVNSGGIVGSVNGGLTIESCLASGNITADRGNIGGFVGKFNKSGSKLLISQSYYKGTLTNNYAYPSLQDCVGGAVGCLLECSRSSAITDCFIDATISITNRSVRSGVNQVIGYCIYENYDPKISIDDTIVKTSITNKNGPINHNQYIGDFGGSEESDYWSTGTVMNGGLPILKSIWWIASAFQNTGSQITGSLSAFTQVQNAKGILPETKVYSLGENVLRSNDGQRTKDEFYGRTVITRTTRTGGNQAIEGEYVTIEFNKIKGYTFDSNYNQKGYAVNPNIISLDENNSFIMPATNVVITARWIANEYDVQYDGNGATNGPMENSKHTYDVSKNLTSNSYEKRYEVTLDFNGSGESNRTEIIEYTYAGWATSSSGSQAYSDGQSIVNLTSAQNGTFVLYAKWTTPETTTITLPTPNERTGYTFGGWYEDSAFTISAGSADDIYTPTKSITLYAKWIPNIYNVTLDNQGGNGGTSEYYYYYNTKINNTSVIGEIVYYYTDSACTTPLGANSYTIEKPSKTSYYFEGYYYVDESGSKIYYVNSNGECVNDLYKRFSCNVTLHASWIPIVKVTLDNQSATSAGTGEYYYIYNTYINGIYYYSDSSATTKLGSNGYTISTPTRTGYTFGGYYTDINGKGTQYVNSSGGCINNLYTVYNSDVTLYANWIPNIYKVTLDKQSGSGGTSEYYYYYKTTIINSLVNGGIIYYYTDSICSNPLGDNSYTIRQPSRTGYTFGGYYTEINGQGTQYVNSNGVCIGNLYNLYSENITLYASWIPNKYKVTLDKQGGRDGTSNFYYKYGEKKYYNEDDTELSKWSIGQKNYLLTIPERENYLFTGYYTDKNGQGSRYINALGTITGDIYKTNSCNITLYANWIDNNAYSITYDLDGGTDPGNITSYCTTYPTFELEEPTKEGYIFKGWTGSNGTIPQTKVYIEQGSTGHKEYKANWEAKTNTVSVSVSKVSSENINSGDILKTNDTIFIEKQQITKSSGSFNVESGNEITISFTSYKCTSINNNMVYYYGDYVTIGISGGDASVVEDPGENFPMCNRSITYTYTLKIKVYSNCSITIKWYYFYKSAPTTKTCSYTISSCLEAGTKIAMADGSTKNIEEIMSGDKVLSYNTKKGIIEETTVLERIDVEKKKTLTVRFKDGTFIKTTSDHMFYSEKGWVAYSPHDSENSYPGVVEEQLSIGDKLFSENGSFEKEVISIEENDYGSVYVYNLKLENNFNFFANGVLAYGVQ